MVLAEGLEHALILWVVEVKLIPQNHTYIWVGSPVDDVAVVIIDQSGSVQYFERLAG